MPSKARIAIKVQDALVQEAIVQIPAAGDAPLKYRNIADPAMAGQGRSSSVAK
jgi:hypothetical protein